MIKTKLLLLLLCISTTFFTSVGQNKSQPYYFDFGPEDSEVSDQAVLVTDQMIYSTKEGFGWLEKPERAFDNQYFERSRDAFNIDGVEGKKLEFQVDVPEGEWWITLYADAGYEDTSTVNLTINDQSIDLGWHAFQPSAEPRKEIQTSYRVFQGLFSTKEFIRVSFEGGDYKARLLGLTLIPKSSPKNSTQNQILADLNRTGKYPGDTQITDIYDKLGALNEKEPKDPFYAFWYQQVMLLYRAEDHFMKRGWEKYIQIDGLSIWGQLHQAVMILDGMLNHTTPENNPLYERARFLRGRILYWLGLERGGPNEISRGAADLAALYKIYPGDTLLAMYNGELVDLPDPCDGLESDPNAPDWSVKQRELMCRMRNIAHWWVLEQQSENGEFGGKLGDDVELLRWWTPLLLAGDSLAFVGWSKLADEIFRNRKVYKGYSKKPIDVEHASEFIADTAPMMVVSSDESKYVDRLKYSADYFENLWTGKSVNGNRFFRSSWYSSTEVDENPPRNRDHGYNSRATKAVRYYAWKTQDKQVMNSLNEWSTGWLNAANRTDKGKPKGIMPASVRFPDESFNGDEPNWYQANMFWEYFEWEANAGVMILDQLLFSYANTRDEKFLEPLFLSLDLIQKYADNDGNAEVGSEAWAAGRLKEKSGFWGVAAQWRFLTGDTKYDELLLRYGTPYLKYRLSGDEKHLEDGLDIVLENARYNTPLKTYEAIHTDRVYIRGYEHLTTMLTGNGSKEGLSPFYAITWEKTNNDFTALLKKSDFENLVLQVYSHSQQNIKPIARVWQLDPGDYDLILNESDDQKTSLKILKTGQRIVLDIPPNELTTVEIRKK